MNSIQANSIQGRLTEANESTISSKKPGKYSNLLKIWFWALLLSLVAWCEGKWPIREIVIKDKNWVTHTEKQYSAFTLESSSDSNIISVSNRKWRILIKWTWRWSAIISSPSYPDETYTTSEIFEIK